MCIKVCSDFTQHKTFWEHQNIWAEKIVSFLKIYSPSNTFNTKPTNAEPHMHTTVIG